MNRQFFLHTFKRSGNEKQENVWDWPSRFCSKIAKEALLSTQVLLFSKSWHAATSDIFGGIEYLVHKT